MAERPRDKTDGDSNRLEVPGWHCDHRAPAFTAPHLLEPVAHRLDVPGHVQRRLAGMQGFKDLHHE
jgi:hypothetical protein